MERSQPLVGFNISHTDTKVFSNDDTGTHLAKHLWVWDRSCILAARSKNTSETLYSLWHKSSPSPPIHWWPCAVCQRGRAVSVWPRLLWVVKPTQDLEKGMTKTMRRTTTSGTRGDWCHEGRGRKQWPALCSAQKEKEAEHAEFLRDRFKNHSQKLIK